MLRLSRKTLLAIEAVLDIAYYGRIDPVQAKEITARQGVPHRYLEQIMQYLVRQAILKGVRGPRGGYTLARERRKITIGEIVRLISQMEMDDETEDVSASDLGQQVISPIWTQMVTGFMAELSTVTIEDLYRQAVERGIKRHDDQKPDFTI